MRQPEILRERQVERVMSSDRGVLSGISSAVVREDLVQKLVDTFGEQATCYFSRATVVTRPSQVAWR